MGPVSSTAPSGPGAWNIVRFPYITEAHIRDRSKGDSLVKFVAVIQVVWLAIQLSIRAATGRQSSQIEIMALAFAVCAAITYLLLLYQPNDVQTPVFVLADRDVNNEEFSKIVASRAKSDSAGNYPYPISTNATPHAPTYRSYIVWQAFGTSVS